MKIQIECERVILRTYVEADLDDIYNITLQPEIAKYLPDWVASKEQRQIWLTKYEIPENNMFMKAMPHVTDNIVRLAIILKESNQLIGWVVSGIKDGVPNPNREIAYGISNKYTDSGAKVFHPLLLQTDNHVFTPPTPEVPSQALL